MESPTWVPSSSCPDIHIPLVDVGSSRCQTPSDVRPGPARADVVVVAYETPDLLDRCLSSLRAARAADDRVGRIVVVDNSAGDECAGIANRHPSVELVRPLTNVGFGRAANLGLATTRDGAPYALILNADTEVRRGAVGALIDHLAAHPTAAIAGPSLVDDAGDVQASCGSFPTAFRVFLAQSGLWRSARRVSRRRAAMPFRNPVGAGAVPWVLGAALMVDREAIEAVGGFDPGFHMYFEEVDLSSRLLGLRRETHFVPHATIAHVGGASTSRTAGPMERLMYSSLARHVRLHGGRPRLGPLRVAVAAVALGHLAQAIVRSDSREPWIGILSDAVHGWTG